MSKAVVTSTAEKRRGRSQVTSGGRLSFWLLWAALLVLQGIGWAAPTPKDLAPDLGSGGSSVITLTFPFYYTLSYEVQLDHSVTIEAGGSSDRGVIENMVGPINAKTSGITLTINNCDLQGDGWSCVAADTGAQVILNNCTLNCPGGTGLYINGAQGSMTSCTVNVSDTGVNALAASQLVLTNTSFLGCHNAIQQSDGTLNWTGGSVNNSAGTGIFLNGGLLVLANLSLDNAFYGIQVSNNPLAILTDVDITSSTYNYQQTGGRLIWAGGNVRGIGTAIHLENLTGAVLKDLTVTQTRVNAIGVNFAGTTSGTLHGVAISGASHALQVHSGNATMDQNCQFSCPYPEFGGAGSGVASIFGAPLTVLDSTFTGFENGVDIQPFTPKGTALVQNCRFISPKVSSVSAFQGENVRMTNCVVTGALCDGVYYDHSTGVIENCVVTGSLNTGVTFWACPSGTIRNCHIADSAHQGLSIVEGSQNIIAFNNTILDSAITNLLVDATSTAFSRGNIYANAAAPNACVHLHGTPNTRLDTDLLLSSKYGMDIQQSAHVTMNLCALQDHQGEGILVYDNSVLTARNVVLEGNGIQPGNTDAAFFVNTGAQVTARGCHMGLMGTEGFYNNATVPANVAYCYWGSALGPYVQWYGDPGTGATVKWNHTNGASVVYTPFLTGPILERGISKTVSLSDGVETVVPAGKVTLRLTGKTGMTPLSGQIAGAVRCADTSYLTDWTLPSDLWPGQVFSVWVGYELRANASPGKISFSAPDVPDDEGAGLMRLRDDGAWEERFDSSFDLNTKILTFAPSDPHLLNGLFVLVQRAGRAAASSWRRY